MSLPNLIQLLLRSTAIKGFELASKMPSVVAQIPSARIRRLIAIAAQSDQKYAGIYSRSAYAPWRGDERFQRAFAKIRGNTLVDEYRCHELWQVCAQLGSRDQGDILEVGVWRGGTGCLLAQCCREHDIPGTVFLCDTFTGVVNAGDQDSAYVGGEHADTSLSTVLDLVAGLNLENVEVLQGIFPESTGARIQDRRFRMCHIDVDVYESASHVFEWVWPRLVPGGVVVFDDYGFYSCGGVTRMVDRMRGESDRLVFYNVNGHALVIKRG